MLMDEVNAAAEFGVEGTDGLLTYDRHAGRVHEERTFELPGSIWAMMFGSYAVFFGGLAIAVGGTFDALGMVIISVCFAIMYFGTATVMVKVARGHRASGGRPEGSTSDSIETLTGRLSYGAAAAQILTVPALFGFFALSIVIIRMLTFAQ